jgi:hypothetical protein
MVTRAHSYAVAIALLIGVVAVICNLVWRWLGWML